MRFGGVVRSRGVGRVASCGCVAAFIGDRQLWRATLRAYVAASLSSSLRVNVLPDVYVAASFEA